MPDFRAEFETAAKAAQALPKRPDNSTLLKLYALYKQATTGDVGGSRPGFTDLVGRSKYDAWAQLKGTSHEQAMRDYVALVERLKSS